MAGIAWHGYGGTPGAMLALHDKYPQKGQYQTEHSGGTWVSDQVRADFPEIIHVMRSWGRAFVKWGMALDRNRGPHAGGCGTCTPLVTVSSASGAMSYPIDSNGGLNIGYAGDGDQLGFAQVNFPGGLGAVDVRVASAGSGGRIDAPDGPPIASVRVPVTGGWQSWQTVSSSMSGVSGVHDVYLMRTTLESDPVTFSSPRPCSSHRPAAARPVSHGFRCIGAAASKSSA